MTTMQRVQAFWERRALEHPDQHERERSEDEAWRAAVWNEHEHKLRRKA